MASPSMRRRLGAAAAALTALVAPLAVALPAHASATAEEIVYTADEDGDGIYSVVLRDLATRRITTLLAANTTDEWIYDDPELSPDGGRVALSTDRETTDFAEGIAVVNRDGTGFRRLTTPPSTSATVYAIDVAPAWSPDGRTIAFTRITTDSTTPAAVKATTAIWTVPTDGSTPASALPGAGDGYTADWSPDGGKLVFAAVPQNDAEADSGPITVINRDGSGRTTLGTAVGLMPAWSPDGSTIAYATVVERDADRATPEDVTNIAVVPAAGGAPTVFGSTRPTSARTVAEYPAWSADGESIYFDLFGYSSTDSFPPGDIWAVDKAGLRAGRITSETGDEAQPHAQGPAPAAVSAGAASTYVPVTPQRILNTRTTAKVGPAGTVDVPIHGVTTAEGTVPATATAVILNVTVTQPTAATDVRAYPSGSPVPGASNLNAAAGQTVPNLVTVRIGTNGAVTLRNAGGSVHLLADIAGYYVPEGAGSGFAPLDPGRVFDTRSGVGTAAGRLGPGGVRDLDVIGTFTTTDGTSVTVPAGARAVVLNVTATGGSALTDVRVYPTPADPSSFPLVSNLNVQAGQTAPNLVTVRVGEGGKVRLRNAAGEVHLLADIAGYYAPGAAGRFVPVVPSRFLDTRSGVGAAAIPTTAQAFVDLKVAGTRGVPAGATAAVLNLTGTAVTAATDVRAYPLGASRVPTASNLNLSRGVTRANLTIVKTGTDGRIRIRNAGGQLNLIGDLAGYMVG